MKIIFVGLHNKPGKAPLCYSTKSGKLIYRIVKEGGYDKWLKTNLYDTEYYPDREYRRYYTASYWHRVKPRLSDVIVLLGAVVQKDFQYLESHTRYVKIAHPASKRSHKAMDEYVADAIAQINKVIQSKQ